MATRSHLRVAFIVLALAGVAGIVTDLAAQRGRRGGRGGFDAAPVARILPEDLPANLGVATIPDRATFEALAYQGPNPGRDRYLAGLQFVKFVLDDADAPEPLMYFMNTKVHQGHPSFMDAAGIGRSGRGGGQMRGALTYRPLVRAPNGQPGVYTFDFQPNDAFPFAMIKICYDLLIEKAPLLDGTLVYHPLQGAVSRYQRERELYEQAGLPVYLDDDLLASRGFLPLNPAESFGWLRLMSLDQIPSANDIVIYRALPNELPRVAGIITEVRQTPLSHVNLRAVQDKVPNAFIEGASDIDAIEALIDRLVYYAVTPDGFEVREATPAELDAHFAALRPAEARTPLRDLTVTDILPLDDVTFAQSSAVGVKAANLAAMRRFGLPEGTVPDGYAVPFWFYDTFMQANGLYDRAREMVASPAFRDDLDTRRERLAEFRETIEDGTMPEPLAGKLERVQRSFPAGTPIRARSSTNNEDLPGFSGAGLYDSYTHRPDEGHLEKTIQQVFASMWNFRAFEEREFYRIDHFAAAMGVLLHPNYEDERANGVAVTRDILYRTAGNSYVNVQLGEDLVTNPEAESTPEEILLGWGPEDGEQLMQRSNLMPDDERLLSADHLASLRSVLDTIHLEFSRLYEVSPDDPDFAMEIEFKITREGRLEVKQARPWVS